MLRGLTTTASAQSGHSRWSKIKHDKGKNDAAKHHQRSMFSKEIATASKLFGPESNANHRLANLISKAKKEGFAKASIEAAIARGQGRSVSGASLENVTVEGILPNNVAVIVECETDSKLRTLGEVRLVIRDHGGTVTPTSYLFTKKGKITYDARDDVRMNEILDAAIDAGASDVEEGENGEMIVISEPNLTRSVGDTISQALGLDIAASEIIWVPNEDTKVEIQGKNTASDLISFLDDLQEKESSVQTVAMNISQTGLASESWKDLQGRICV